MWESWWRKSEAILVPLCKKLHPYILIFLVYCQPMEKSMLCSCIVILLGTLEDIRTYELELFNRESIMCFSVKCHIHIWKKDGNSRSRGHHLVWLFISAVSYASYCCESAKSKQSKSTCFCRSSSSIPYCFLPLYIFDPIPSKLLCVSLLWWLPEGKPKDA